MIADDLFERYQFLGFDEATHDFPDEEVVWQVVLGVERNGRMESVSMLYFPETHNNFILTGNSEPFPPMTQRLLALAAFCYLAVILDR